MTLRDTYYNQHYSKSVITCIQLSYLKDRGAPSSACSVLELQESTIALIISYSFRNNSCSEESNQKEDIHSPIIPVSVSCVITSKSKPSYSIVSPLIKLCMLYFVLLY